VIGPLIDMMAVAKVEAHIAEALKKGAQVVTGGKRAAHQHEDGAAASSSRRC
jgi:succinate-semialdehyde dehydrogenase / glutarate-semialdehyde dehydrogenase